MINRKEWTLDDIEKELGEEESKSVIEDMANRMSVSEAIEVYRNLFTTETWTIQKMNEFNAAGLKLKKEGVNKPSVGYYQVIHDEDLTKEQAQVRIKGYVIMKKFDRANQLLTRFGYPKIKLN